MRLNINNEGNTVTRTTDRAMLITIFAIQISKDSRPAKSVGDELLNGDFSSWSEHIERYNWTRFCNAIDREVVQLRNENRVDRNYISS